MARNSAYPSKFLIAAGSLVYLFLYVPLAVVVLFSFNDSKLNAEWVGFTWKWYHKLFQNGDILHAAANSLIIATISALLGTLYLPFPPKMVVGTSTWAHCHARYFNRGKPAANVHPLQCHTGDDLNHSRPC